MLLKVKGLIYSIENKRILNDLKLEIQTGQIGAILGANGSGKSTLLKLLAGLLEPDSGEILLHKEKVLGPREKLLPGHAKISLVKQDSSLLPNHTVRENLLYVLRSSLSSIQKKKIQELSTLLDLKQNLDRVLKFLSGGEQQRVAIAASLAASPKLLLMDEPFSQTDQYLKQRLKIHLQNIVDHLGIGIIYVTHDPQDALAFSDKLFILNKGKIVESGTSQSLYYYPKKKSTAVLTGYCNWLPAKDYQEVSHLHKIKNNFLIRPDQIKITNEMQSQSLNAVVQKLSFFGTYSLVHLFLPKKNSYLLATHLPSQVDPQIGQELFISL